MLATFPPPPLRCLGAGYSTNIQTPPPPFNELVMFRHGYGRVIVHNVSALEFNFIDDSNGTVADTMWIMK